MTRAAVGRPRFFDALVPGSQPPPPPNVCDGDRRRNLEGTFSPRAPAMADAPSCMSLVLLFEFHPRHRSACAPPHTPYAICRPSFHPPTQTLDGLWMMFLFLLATLRQRRFARCQCQHLSQREQSLCHPARKRVANLRPRPPSAPVRAIAQPEAQIGQAFGEGGQRLGAGSDGIQSSKPHT